MSRIHLQDAFFGGFLVVLSVLAIVLALSWTWQVSLVPVITAGLFGGIAALDLIKRRSSDQASVEAEPGVLRGALWFLGVIALVVLLGLQLGLALAILLLCRFAFHQPWRVVIGTLAGLALVLWSFDAFFHVFWPTPLILGGSFV